MRIILLLIIWSMMFTTDCVPHDIKELIILGKFSEAESLISELLLDSKLQSVERLELLFQKEHMQRIRKDFSKTEADVIGYIKKYIPEVKNSDLKKWEDAGDLEFKVIDGKKFYFNRAAENLFRINSVAFLRKTKKIGVGPSKFKLYFYDYVERAVKKARKTKSAFLNPKRMLLNFKLVVDADAIPSGEVIRCWLPYPRSKGERQKDIKLISLNNDNYIISPEEYSHRTMYSEQVSRKGKPTIFEVSVEFTGVDEYHFLDADKVEPYKKNTGMYKEYTSERYPHIVFTDNIKQISDKIVGDETNPILIAKKIYKWIDENIRWAGAREYSTIENISNYCLSTMHGDCGIKTLTFITLARYNGIPARWESGLMLHPDKLNLHDWCEIYFEGMGWIPVDQSFGLQVSADKEAEWFYFGSNDGYHMIVNDDYSKPLYPAKVFPRSETIDFQRGEVEWRGGNIYFDKWNYYIDVKYLGEK